MRTVIALMFNLVVTVFLFSLSADGQQSLGDKKITIHLERVNFRKVIEVLIEKYDVAVSFEQSQSLSSKDAIIEFNFEQNIRYVPEKKDGSLVIWPEQPDQAEKYRFSVNFDEAKLSEVIDNIVAQMPDYKWEINDGVVNIFPAKSRDSIFEELLAIKIAKFDLEKPYISQFQQEILAMPELTKFVKDNGLCTSKYNGLNPVFMSRQLPDDIHFSDVTLKELLNRITKIKRGGWILRKFRYEAECIDLQL